VNAYVSGAAAISPTGFEWRGIATTIAKRAQDSAEARNLEVPEIPKAIDAGDHRAHKLMSRGARLAAVAMKRAIADAGWTAAACETAGAFLGVGASGGSMVELNAMLGASIENHTFSLERMAHAGLAACNPLFAFQLMNNFTLCHGSILAGLGGPNGALYSRGNGTLVALFEAMHAIESGDCERALAGGADSALHPVTQAELVRDGIRDLEAAEGAALLALTNTRDAAIAEVHNVAFGTAGEVESFVATVLQQSEADHVVIAPCNKSAREALRGSLRHLPLLDVTRALGESLAATPALAWVTALDLVASGQAQRVLALHIGVDGIAGSASFRRPL
jgi:hypothetical protein